MEHNKRPFAPVLYARLEADMRDQKAPIEARFMAALERYSWGNYKDFAVHEDQPTKPLSQSDFARLLKVDIRRLNETVLDLERRGKIATKKGRIIYLVDPAKPLEHKGTTRVIPELPQQLSLSFRPWFEGPWAEEKPDRFQEYQETIEAAEKLLEKAKRIELEALSDYRKARQRAGEPAPKSSGDVRKIQGENSEASGPIIRGRADELSGDVRTPIIIEDCSIASISEDSPPPPNSQPAEPGAAAAPPAQIANAEADQNDYSPKTRDVAIDAKCKVLHLPRPGRNLRQHLHREFASDSPQFLFDNLCRFDGQTSIGLWIEKKREDFVAESERKAAEERAPAKAKDWGIKLKPDGTPEAWK